MDIYIVVLSILACMAAAVIAYMVLRIRRLSDKNKILEEKIKAASVSDTSKKEDDDSKENETQWLYDTDENGAIIYGYAGENVLSGRVIIPDRLGGMPVTRLGSRIFYECKHIEEIDIPDTVTEIGYAAFAICNKLSVINFPANLRVIPADCFNECGFKKLEIPDTIRSISRGAFVNNRSLESVTLPKGIEEINLMTFAGCSSLKSIEIPEGVRKIGDGAFSDCKSLEAVSLPKSLEEICMMSFLACRNLKTVHIPSADIEIGDMAFDSSTDIVQP